MKKTFNILILQEKRVDDGFKFPIDKSAMVGQIGPIVHKNWFLCIKRTDYSLIIVGTFYFIPLCVSVTINMR